MTSSDKLAQHIARRGVSRRILTQMMQQETAAIQRLLFACPVKKDDGTLYSLPEVLVALGSDGAALHAYLMALKATTGDASPLPATLTPNSDGTVTAA